VELYKQARQKLAEDLAAYQAERERYELERERWKAAQKKGANPGDPPVEPQPPIEQRLLVSDVTCEKLGVLLQDNPLGLLLMRDELAAWIGAFDRYASGGKGSDAPAWLSFFDAAPVVIDRKSAAGTVFVERGSVSVLQSIQPGYSALPSVNRGCWLGCCWCSPRRGRWCGATSNCPTRRRDRGRSCCEG
jgi:hypothetical protein